MFGFFPLQTVCIFDKGLVKLRRMPTRVFMEKWMQFESKLLRGGIFGREKKWAVQIIKSRTFNNYLHSRHFFSSTLTTVHG